MNMLCSNELAVGRTRLAIPTAALVLLALAIGGCDSDPHEDGLVLPQLRTVDGDTLTLVRPVSIEERNRTLPTLVLVDENLRRQVYFSAGDTCTELGEREALPTDRPTDLGAPDPEGAAASLEALVHDLDEGKAFSIVVDWWTEPTTDQFVELDSVVYVLEKLVPPAPSSDPSEPDSSEDEAPVIYVGPPADSAGVPIGASGEIVGTSMLPLAVSPADPCGDPVGSDRSFSIDLDGDGFPNLVELNGGVAVEGVMMEEGGNYPSVPQGLDPAMVDSIVTVSDEVILAETLAEPLMQTWGRLSPLVLANADTEKAYPLAMAADSEGAVFEVVVPRADLGDLTAFETRFPVNVPRPALVVNDVMAGTATLLCREALMDPTMEPATSPRSGWIGVTSGQPNAEIVVRCDVEPATPPQTPPYLSEFEVKLMLPADASGSDLVEWTLGTAAEPLGVLFVDPLVQPSGDGRE